MKLKPVFIFLAFLLAFSSNAVAQQVTVNGTVVDTLSYMNMHMTSVSLIRQSDSVLEAFTRADEEGKFSLKVNGEGKYIVLIAHPNFANYIDVVSIDKNPMELGNMQMTNKEHLLQEVIISDARAIRIKGDTVEYAADSFKVREFANVDELLKRLPGIEVDKNGNITAHGEKVQKMYVDGDEFFTDDPAMVAKTLRASAVDKVQVYDKKSEQAEFTGIDDGEKIKTINLVLKDNAKKGYFGKISAGGGLPDYWENQAMINSFRSKRKMAVYGTMSNTNTAGLNWEDNRKYGSGSEGRFNMEDGDFVNVIVNSSSNEDDDPVSWGGQFNGQGLPKSWNAGAMYGNKFFQDKLNFNTNYQFAKFNIDVDNNTRTQYVLPDTQYVNNSWANSFSSRQKHGAGLTADYKIDSLTSVKLTVNGTIRNSISDNDNYSEAITLAGNKINTSSQKQNVESNNKSISSNLIIRRKFKKEGRTLSLSLDANTADKASQGDYFTNNYFAAIAYNDTINQRKINDGKSFDFGSKLSFTEMLTKVMSLELNYGLQMNNSQSSNYSYNKDEVGNVSSQFDSLYSSDYRYNILTNRGGANLRFKYDRLNFSFGGAVANSDYKQDDLIQDTTHKYNYLNFFPQASIKYSVKGQTNVRFDYRGNSQQPSLSQLQPIRQNNDPLNIMIGNPNLKQAFMHNFNLTYNDYKVFKERYIYSGLGFNLIQDAITQSQNITNLGQRTYQYINMDGNYNSYLYAGMGVKIKPLNVRAGINFNANYSHNNTMLNGVKSASINQGYTPGIDLSYQKDSTIDISYNINVGYNRSTTSIRPDVINDYWSVTQEFDASYLLPKNFLIGTDFNWLYRQKIDAQDNNNNVMRWNAYIQKSFLKDRSLALKLYVNDILNQNKGFQRNAADNYITESQYNTIRRYVMLSLTWNFTRSGAMAKGGEVQQDAATELNIGQ